ncbi:hypothetical protein H4696_003879 [Amycolatopsis lexingtonensis]|uniref:Uncharacterized protein n=1 Tax=Amycolatopsis lexingtonensis TaxID=218822 RepID=A0ABR9I0V7_9PSEU|nr:hypothetical protein [Amycolatopsis lexingtonensis]MBE1496779.1 hypothetical protein [Amycolatopsis lexingtonensis]
MSKNTTETIAGGAIALLVPLCVGFAADWPVWVTALAAVTVFLITLWGLRSYHFRTEQAQLRAENAYRQQMAAQQTPPPPPPPAPGPPPSRAVAPMSLPSSLEGIPFTFGCTVHWDPAELRHNQGHADPAAVATAAIVERARQISRSHHPDDDAVVHSLAASLGRPAATSDRSLQAWATDVKTQVGQHHREHLNALAALRRQQQLQEQRIANQRMMRAYLGDEVLTDVGSTVVWWLARNEEEVRETVDLIGTLARLSAAANNQEVDELFRHLVPENAAPRPAVPPPSFFTPPEPAFFVDAAGEVNPAAEDRGAKVDLLPDPDDAQNSLFGHQLADLAERHGHSDLAQEYRERYRTVDATGPSGSVAPPEEQGGFFGHEPPLAEPPTGNGGAPSYPDAPDREPGSEDRRDWGAGG